ncbi:Methyl-accepting chemotaxis protein 2 [Thalassovita gelatinovora]|uniref:Methyl-accepting chemotaxis protein 2 n=1 Tax=Thalassovita gelatinovora TaxID=53501 RepID=A0A0N7LU70_THAGE|nr:methyl-accepting chemotaxis protein [Thalassovita gelatinovora]QIZ79372.1 methyl-accepting chemotaxis protein [Thalassovita gelatinovora]CUH62674.1 Methyl-accepting chemotaxis protein 2 [Thalassovita gelatinovora]SEQ08310.1 methyl-accepting chemotaxis protein [Thalassovita gelatinovora]
MDASQINAQGATAVANDANENDDRLQAITEIATRIGNLSISIAEVSGEVTDTSTRVDRQAEVFQEIAAQTEQMSSQSRSVLASANTAVEISGNAEDRVIATSDKLSAMVSEVTGLIDNVSRIFGQLSSLETALQRVAQVSGEVDNISRKTNLLSLNASIEAARAGRHGRGFMVVAQEVKDLSTLTGEATGEIQETIATLSSELREVMKIADQAVKSAGDIRQQTDGIGDEIDALPATLGEVSSAQRDILAATGDISQAVGDVRNAITELSGEVTESSESLKNAITTMSDITENSEALTGMASRLGVDTIDTPYIVAVKEVAKKISDSFEQAVKSGRIQMSDLMDRNYSAIPGSNPEQVMARFTNFTDKVLPEFQEPMLEFSENVVFCAAVNKDGYLPTHNKKFSMPQMKDQLDWNSAYCRNRRIFNDRVGLAAGQSTRPFLLQAYRRDMGNGQFAMMKDLSAPIFVNGVHWGGVRLAYKV